MEGSLSNKFTLGNQLGSTRSADLYLAQDKSTNEQVLVWVLRHTLPAGSKAADRFVKRIEQIKSLEPSPVNIIEAGVDENGATYAAFELFEGGPLALAKYDKQQVEWLFPECVRWISLLHAKGLVCGDITHSSFWVRPDWSVCFIGIMGSFDVEADSTTASPPVDTYHFLAPEQRSGSGAEMASDVYALGVLGYVLTSQKFPVQDNKKILLGAPELSDISALSELVEIEPVWSRVLVQRTLANLTSSRFSSAGELLECLVSVAEGAAEEKYLVGESQLPALMGGRDELVERRGRDGLVKTDERDFSPEKIGEKTIGEVRPNPDRARQAAQKILDDDEGLSSVWVVGIGAMLGLVILLGVSGLLIVLFSSGGEGTGGEGVEVASSATGESDSGIEGSLKRLLTAVDPEEGKDIILDLVKQHGAEGFSMAVNMASEYKLKGDSQLMLLEESILKAIGSFHGPSVERALRLSLSTGSLNSCYSSALLLFSPKLETTERKSYLADCHAVAPLSSLTVLAVKALDQGSSKDWMNMFRSLAAEALRLEGNRDRSIGAIVMSHKELRNALSPARHQELVAEMSDEDLLWTFGELNAEDYVSFGLLAAEISERKVIKSPKSAFLAPFMQQVPIDPKLRESLLRAVGGDIDESLVQRAGLWLDERAGRILLAACSLSESESVHRKAFDSLSNRHIAMPLADEIFKWIRKSRWDARYSFSRTVCDSAFYSDLGPEKRQEVIDGYGSFVNEDRLIEIILESDRVQLVRNLTEKYGKNFSLHLLMKLLSYDDKQTRIYAVNHLKYYNNLIVLREIVEKFRAEKDEDVKDVYREHFWVVRQSEKKAGGMDEVE